MNDLAKTAARLAHPIFVSEGWTYGGIGVPSVAELEKTVARLIATLGERDAEYVASGRFRVTRGWHGTGGGQVAVALELADHWDEDDD